MSLLIDSKFVTLVSHKLSRFTKKQNNLYKDETKEPIEEEKSETEEPPSSDKEPADEPAEPVVESKQREGVINCEKCSTPLQLEQDEIEAGEYYCPYCMQVSKLP